MTDIVAINRFDMVALTDDGMVIEFDQMFDAQGDSTDDPEIAEVVIAEMPDGNLAVIVLSDFDGTASLH